MHILQLILLQSVLMLMKFFKVGDKLIGCNVSASAEDGVGISLLLLLVVNDNDNDGVGGNLVVYVDIVFGDSRTYTR